MPVLVDGLSARAGGGIVYLANLLPALARQPGIGPVRVALAPGAHLGDLLAGTEVQVHRLEPRSAGLVGRLAWEATRLGRDAGAGVVLSPSAILPRRLPGPVVAVPHNMLPFRAGGTRNRLRRRSILRTLDWATAAIYVSEEMRREIRRASGRPELDRVIPHGVGECFRAPAVSPADRRSGVVCVADHYPHKRLELLIDAVRLLAPDAPSLTLIGAGRGRPTATAAGVDHERSLSPAQVARRLRGAALAVLPSTIESFGLPALEAMACATPLLVTDIPSLREVTGGHAEYVDSDQPEVWARRIREMIARPPPTSAAREWALGFTWERTARATAELLMAADQHHAERGGHTTPGRAGR